MSGLRDELPDRPDAATDADLLIAVVDHLLAPIEDLVASPQECFAAYTAPEPINIAWQRLLGIPDSNRDVVAASPRITRFWGTLRGIHEFATALLGDRAERIEVDDNAEASWTTDPGYSFPDLGPPSVDVRVWCQDVASVDAGWLEAVLRTAVPAHVALQVTIAPS